MATTNGTSGTAHGWVTFSGTLFAVAGVWNLWAGLSALLKKESFNENGLVFGNLQAWGWVWLALGAVQIGICYLLFANNPLGRTLGLVFAALSMVVWFGSLGGYPSWAFLIVAVDGAIVYGLAAHPEAFSTPRR